MRCTRLTLIATLLAAVTAQTAYAQDGSEDDSAEADSAATATRCAAVDSVVVDSAVQDALAALRGTRPMRPKLIVVHPTRTEPTYRALEAVQWQTIDLSDGVHVEVGAVHTDPVTRVRQLLLRLPPNSTVPPHWHGGHETMLVVRGSVLVRDSSDRVVRLSAGGFSFQPAAAPHSLTTGPAEGALLLVTSDGSWDIHLVEEPRSGPPRERPRTAPRRLEVGLRGRP